MAMDSRDGPSPATTPTNRRPIIFLFLLLCVLFVISYTGRMGQLIGLNSEITAKQAELEAIQERQAALEKEQAYTRTEQYTDEVAREQLGLSQAGDELIVAVGVAAPVGAADRVTGAAPARADGSAPIWRQWWQLFTPGGT